MSEINIIIDKENIKFTSLQYTISLLPLVVLEMVKGKEVIKAVGVDIPSGSGIKKIFLFDSIDKERCGNKKHILDVFFSYGLQQIRRKRSFLHTFIRPVVNVSNLESLDGLLLGYEYHLIEDSLLFAGARKVNYIDKD